MKKVAIGILAIAIIVVLGLIIRRLSDRDSGVEVPGTPTTTSPTATPTSQSRMVNLYYYNLAKDRALNGTVNGCDDEAILPVTRLIPMTITPVQDTLKLLLQGGLTKEERDAGFTTEFPHDGFVLRGANMKNGVLTLEFSEVPGFTSGGACRMDALSSVIEKTALQFEGVKEVKFLPEEIFQP